jgi:hypothetical protein
MAPEITTQAEPTEKPPISEKKLAANRRNSQKSTGPRTERGKAVSSMNGCVHGRRAKRAVLPGESQEEFDEDVELWVAALGAETEPERCLARLAVEAKWRLARHGSTEIATLTDRRNKAREGFDDERATEAHELAEKLDLDPAAILRELRTYSAGCEWLIGCWEKIGRRLESPGYLEQSHRQLGCALMGQKWNEMFTNEAVTAFMANALGTVLGHTGFDFEQVYSLLETSRPEWMNVGEYRRQVKALMTRLPEKAAARRGVQALVAERLAELRERLELIGLREERDRKLAARQALQDTSEEGKAALRFFNTHDRALKSSLREARLLRAARLAGTDGPEPEPEPAGATSEANGGEGTGGELTRRRGGAEGLTTEANGGAGIGEELTRRRGGAERLTTEATDQAAIGDGTETSGSEVTTEATAGQATGHLGVAGGLETPETTTEASGWAASGKDLARRRGGAERLTTEATGQAATGDGTGAAERGAGPGPSSARVTTEATIGGAPPSGPSPSPSPSPSGAGAGDRPPDGFDLARRPKPPPGGWPVRGSPRGGNHEGHEAHGGVGCGGLAPGF